MSRRLRSITAPFVVAPPRGARVRTRLMVDDHDAAALRAIGAHLGSLAGEDLARRCNEGKRDTKQRAQSRRERKRDLTARSSSRWAGAITRTSEHARRAPSEGHQRTDRTRTRTRLPGDRHRGRRFRREPGGGTEAPGQPPEPRKARQVLPPPRHRTPDREVPRAAHPDGNERRALRRGRRPGLHLEVGSAALAGSPEAGLTAGERPPRGGPRHRQARARTSGTATGKV